MLRLLSLLGALSNSLAGDLLLAYNFQSDLEGWAATLGNDDRERYTRERYMQIGLDAAAPALVHDRRRRMVAASDDSDLVWFFERRAPFNAFMTQAYGGQLV